MEITVAFDRPDQGPDTGPVTVGWFLTTDKGAVLFDAPERLIFRQTNKAHAKSASRCPAVIQLEGPGWRLAWREDHQPFARQPFAVLIGGQGWAVELTAAEAAGLAAAVVDLVCEHQALLDQLLAEEAITLELERGPWWLALEGDR